MGRAKAQVTIYNSEDGRDIKIRPTVAALEDVTLTTADAEQWLSHAVFCHNDLTLHNITLKSYTITIGTTSAVRYKIAALINWEMTGFYPAAYELAL